MATLLIRGGQGCITEDFAPPAALRDVLRKAGVALAHPCGGLGKCGKCAVVLQGGVAKPTAAEMRCAARLSCQAILTGDAEVILPQLQFTSQIQLGSMQHFKPVQSIPGRYAAALDIGTTTLAMQLYDLSTGEMLSAVTMPNPQSTVAADVIGRMAAALKGQGDLLRQMILTAVAALLAAASGEAGIPASGVAHLSVTGNTTMLYLLTGRNPIRLSRAPFEADHLFGQETVIAGKAAYLPPCLHAFVGADAACAILASGMLSTGGTSLLVDVGTNGEMALMHKGLLYVTSTAAGPAFEGAGISCGCGSIPGAIDRITLTDTGPIIHTIGDARPCGLCGSGLLDAIAVLLEMEVIDETGAMDDDYAFADGVVLTQQDVRAVQLAKAAIAAGLHSLLCAADCRLEAVDRVYLAGGFGSRLSLESAARIGMLPKELAAKARAIGNAALDGASMLLMDINHRTALHELQQLSRHVRLDGNPAFSQRYVEEMLFPEPDE